MTTFLAFVLTVAFWSLSEISRELENPFRDGPNQLPIIDGHERFVELLRTGYHARKPEAPTARTLSVSPITAPASSMSQSSMARSSTTQAMPVIANASSNGTSVTQAGGTLRQHERDSIAGKPTCIDELLEEEYTIHEEHAHSRSTMVACVGATLAAASKADASPQKMEQIELWTCDKLDSDCMKGSPEKLNLAGHPEFRPRPGFGKV
mmetsp:Transcript_13524/g.23568  ORF Transcript_13524/g.23568 Transcript_13524/m.23568 type:complete len:208 (+) Transcript_13524:1-624(+)